MTSQKPETMSSPGFHWFASGGLVVGWFMLMVTVGGPLARAQSAAPEERPVKSGAHAKRSRPATAGQPNKPAGAKAKPRVRGTAQNPKPAAESTQPASEAAAEPATPSSEPEKKPPAHPAVKTTEVVDFDSDGEELRKLEPGLELIKARPKPARHRSLVPASPSPEDSVVNRP